MDVVIPNNRSGEHAISKYQFKILSSLNAECIVPGREEAGRISPSSRLTQEERIESLLKKADELSSNVNKMQTRLDTMQAEHASAVEEARKTAFQKGVAAGISQEQARNIARKEYAQERISASVKTLEKAASEFVNALDAVQKELTHTALEIAKEVIGIETQEKSAKIAAKLSADLIDELKEASKIILRVNPADHGFVSEKVGALARVEVLSDRAISPGGVVAISDAGNIDSEIKKRYERLKRSLLLES